MVSGRQIEEAVVDAFLKALTPAGLEATLLAIQELEANHGSAQPVASGRGACSL